MVLRPIRGEIDVKAISDTSFSLRQQLIKHQLDGFIIGREDMFQGEEVPPSDERLEYISGFTGSSGFAIVTTNTAALFSDGRYSLQMREQTDEENWNCFTLPEFGLTDWFGKYPVNDLVMGIDSRLVTLRKYNQLYEDISRAGGVLELLESNPIDEIWLDQPKISPSTVWLMDEAIAGYSVAEKLNKLAEKLVEQGLRAVLLSRVDSVNWLVNMRGSDLPFTPVNLCFALFDLESGLTLLGDPERLAPIKDKFIEIMPLLCLDSLLAPLAGETMLIEPASLPKSLDPIIAKSNAKIVEGDCPVMHLKACKNQAEVDGFKLAHRHDGVAMVKFLHWLSDINPTDYRESQIASKLEAFRSNNKQFLLPSFATIAGSGPNGAIIHYRAMPGLDQELADGDILLLDSGGHYVSGTTDITRTLLIGNKEPTAEVAEAFTHVLRGHIALAKATFEAGATGQQLDGIAQRHFGNLGLKFPHGTGHGVGHVLSVHEGPANISKHSRSRNRSRYGFVE